MWQKNIVNAKIEHGSPVNHLKKNTILKLCFQNMVNILAKKLFENQTPALTYMIKWSPCVLLFPMYFLVSTHKWSKLSQFSVSITDVAMILSHFLLWKFVIGQAQFFARGIFLFGKRVLYKLIFNCLLLLYKTHFFR